MKVGSLFTGYGGLDMAVGGDLTWYAEIEKAANQVLEAHYPGVPNLGNIKEINWADVEPVDILTGGYPCQPFSSAGNRKGKNDERHLWPYVLDAIRAIRPQYAILENVRGHVSLGFADVLSDLAGIGWACEWGTFRASDIGAPHRRERLFIIAYPNSNGHGQQLHPGAMASVERQTKSETQQLKRARGKSDAGSVDDATYPSRGARGTGTGRGVSEPERATRLTTRPSDIITNSDRTGLQGQRSKGSETPTAGHGLNKPGVSTPTTNTKSNEQREPTELRAFRDESGHGFNAGAIPTNWGKYSQAIHNWESVLTRVAPEPTVQRKDKRRLNPVFVEWMMGLPEGWVTGHGLTPAQELKMLGNGVVPQQAKEAITQLMQRVTALEGV